MIEEHVQNEIFNTVFFTDKFNEYVFKNILYFIKFTGKLFL